MQNAESFLRCCRPACLFCSCVLVISLMLSVTLRQNETHERGHELKSADASHETVSRQLDSNKPTLQTKQEESVAGCLLLRDENHLLAEWLAYHYHVLPLRHLVVSIDPVSLTSPLEILNRFTNGTKEGFEPMTLELWDDSVYNDGHEHDVNDPTFDEGNGIHNNRQRRFARECARYHKDMGRKWVILVDPDEFVVFNAPEDDDPEFTPRIQPGPWMLEQLPTVYEKFLREGKDYNESELKQHYPDLWQERRKKINGRNSWKHFKFPIDGTFVNVMNQSPWAKDSCVVPPRVLFTSVESPKQVVFKSNAAEYGFDPMKFRTQRFLHRAAKDAEDWGKGIVDVSRLPYDDLIEKPENIHTPFSSCGYPQARYEEAIFRLQHYLGTWEEFVYGGDCRKTKEDFDRRNSFSDGTNYDLQQWIGDFVGEVGISQAQFLLQGAGDVPKVPKAQGGCIETV